MSASPTAKFHGLVSLTTVYIMYFVVIHTSQILPNMLGGNEIFAGAATALSGFGLYKALSSCLTWTLKKSVGLRSIILGPTFMHGTWVGVLQGYAGDERYIVEHFEQDLETLQISGRSFTVNLLPHAQWSSISAAINPRQGQLIYGYTCDILSRDTSEQGVGIFLLDRSAAEKAPVAISGYVADLADGKRKPVHEEKISDALLPWDAAAADAKAKFVKPR